jgi:hypothetical protein
MAPNCLSGAGAAAMTVDLTNDERKLLVNLLTELLRADCSARAFSRYGQFGMGSLA